MQGEMQASYVHSCGVHLAPGTHMTYHTQEREIAWEGGHSEGGHGSATIYKFVGTCPACGEELRPEDDKVKVMD